MTVSLVVSMAAISRDFTGGAKHPTREAATFESHCSSDSGFARSRAAFDVVANIHAVLRLIYAGSGGPTCLKITRAGISFWLKSQFPAGATLRICVGRGEDISFSPASIFASLRLTPFVFHASHFLATRRGCLDLLGFTDQRCGWSLGLLYCVDHSRAIRYSSFYLTCFRWVHNWRLRRRRHYLMYRGNALRSGSENRDVPCRRLFSHYAGSQPRRKRTSSETCARIVLIS